MLPLVRGAYGAGLLLAPSPLLAALARMPLDPSVVAVARVLGVRQLAQAALLQRDPSRRAQLAGAVVDALHAISMLGLAHWSPRADHRELARRNAGSASLLALAGVAATGAAGGLADSRRNARFLSK
jgi:hypothetical protein